VKPSVVVFVVVTSALITPLLLKLTFSTAVPAE
jgi:hypothetical protein